MFDFAKKKKVFNEEQNNLQSDIVASWSRQLISIMLDIFLRLKTLIKVSHIHIDSSVFRLHW